MKKMMKKKMMKKKMMSSPQKGGPSLVGLKPSDKGKMGGWSNGKSPSGFEAASHTYTNAFPPYGSPDVRGAGPVR